MKTIGILQARATSTRLPGKVLKSVLGEPMIWRQIERLRRCATLDELILATSTDASDDPLAALCADRKVDCFRGSLDDVLDRFYRAAVERSPAHVVRLTGDCPLIDPDIVDRVVRTHVKNGFDYTSNTVEPTYPDGLDCEAMTLAALETAWREARKPSEREHVTPFLYHHRERFRIGVVRNEVDLSAYRWTVDTPEDFALVSEIFEALYSTNPAFGMADVIELFRRRPDLSRINEGFQRNEGYRTSLRADSGANS